LNDEEAFEIAVIRLGTNFNFEEEYGRVNADTLLIRNILLVFSGIMIYFLLYYSMIVTCRLMFYHLHEVIRDPLQLYRNTRNFLFYYHLIIVAFTIVAFKWNKTFLKKIENFKIKPLHLFLLIALIFSLAFTNFQLQYLVKSEVPIEYLTVAKYYWTLTNAAYSFPLLVAICFLILLIRNKSLRKAQINRQSNGEDENSQLGIEELIKIEYNMTLQELRNAGWNEEEAIALIKVRYNILSPTDGKSVINNNDTDNKPAKLHLVALSGGFVYLLLYYLLNSTSRIFLTLLQYIENDPVKNFGWTKWYIASFHLILIFYTISIYIKDRNILQELKKLSIKRFRFLILLLTTVILALTNYFFIIISRRSFGNIFELKVKFNNILQFSDLSFSFVILVCFMALFNKYYKENMRTY